MPARRLVTFALAAAGVLTLLLLWVYPSRTDFRPDNPFWNGLSKFAAEWRVTSVHSLRDLPADPQGSAAVIIPYRPFRGDDEAAVRRYLTAGGLLMILDDYRFGNELLQGLGVTMRFAKSPVLDPVFYYQSPWLPKATFVSVLSPGDALVLNHATVLTGTSTAIVLAQSSSYAYLEPRTSGSIGAYRLHGPFPVAAWTRIGQGVILVISNPSILLNGMLPLEDNRVFVQRILQMGGERSRVFLDEEHLPAAPLDRAKGALASVLVLLATPPVLIIVLAGCVVAPIATVIGRWKSVGTG